MGVSYIEVSSITHPKHVLVKALENKGIIVHELVFAPHWSNDFGWTLLKWDSGSSYKGKFKGGFLGFSKEEALRFISEL
jgi:hypothetical protein